MILYDLLGVQGGWHGVYWAEGNYFNWDWFSFSFCNIVSGSRGRFGKAVIDHQAGMDLAS
jgi:hypothetical protein